MRRLIAFVLLLGVAATPVMAQTPEGVPQRPDPKPPAMEVIDDSVQPQVTITMRNGEVVEEHHAVGKHERVVVREGTHSRTEAEMLCSFRGCRDEHFW